MKNRYDVLIVGGGPAGLSAALAVGRMGRTALLCDDGRPRNAASKHLNNFPSQDGIHPADWKREVKADLQKYNTVEIENNFVSSIEKKDHYFEAYVGGEIVTASKIILAYGVIDQLPDIPGLKELWGKSVLHCTYCHGFEVRNEKLGLILDSQIAVQSLPSVYELSKDLVLFTEGFKMEPNLKEKILEKNLLIVDTKIKALVHEEENLRKVVLEDGNIISIDRLFLSPRFPLLMKADIGEKLGCEETEFGVFKVSQRNETTVPGIFAAGDIMGMAHTVLLSAAAGNMAGAAAISSLLSEEFYQ